MLKLTAKSREEHPELGKYSDWYRTDFTCYNYIVKAHLFCLEKQWIEIKPTQSPIKHSIYLYWLVLHQLDTAGVIIEKGASGEEMPP
jgi:hypothetical protein